VKTLECDLPRFAALNATDPLVYKIEIGTRYCTALISPTIDGTECPHQLLYSGETGLTWAEAIIARVIDAVKR
jgi:hypothetical protein